MANQSGSVYGLTILSPILEAQDCDLRDVLAALPRDKDSPFAILSSTHMARLVVMDDVIFVGTPAREEHLRSKYLIFESNFDGDLDTYLTRMVQEIPDLVDAVWQHCAGYPGLRDLRAFLDYMKSCQIETTFYFADVNNQSVQSTLRALKIQAGLADFIAANQGKPAAELQAAFLAFFEQVENMPMPSPADKGPCGTHVTIPLNKSIATHHA